MIYMERKMSLEEKSEVEQFIKKAKKDCEKKLFVINKLENGSYLNETDEDLLSKLNQEISA